MSKHAILPPSAAKRWLTCTPSARLELKFPDQESDFAKEGTLAHLICEALVNGFMQSGIALLTLGELNYFKIQEFYSEDMLEHCESFANYIIGFWAEGDILFTEEKLDLKKYIPEGFGHIDDFLLKIKEKHLHVFDFKFGKGVPVFAEDNEQEKIYALGVIEKLEFLGYDIETITLHIYQPRINNITSYSLAFDDLIRWGFDVLKPAAKIAFKGEGEFVAGDHCQFCRVKAKCKALADYNLQIEGYNFEDPAFLKDDDVTNILTKKKLFESWIKAVADLALGEAINGKIWPGYKIVAGRSDRFYKDENEIIKILHANLNLGAITDIMKPRELLGITELTKKLGAKDFNKYVAPLLGKPKPAPALVPESDPRDVYNSAALDFDDEFIEIDEYNEL